jgi:hypothetical protein
MPAARNGSSTAGGRQRQEANLDELQASRPPEDVLALHEALEQFTAHDPLMAILVELRFFGGLTLAECATCLVISLSTADRGWRYARAWLYRAMGQAEREKK